MYCREREGWRERGEGCEGGRERGGGGREGGGGERSLLQLSFWCVLG